MDKDTWKKAAQQLFLDMANAKSADEQMTYMVWALENAYNKDRPLMTAEELFEWMQENDYGLVRYIEDDTSPVSDIYRVDLDEEHSLEVLRRIS